VPVAARHRKPFSSRLRRTFLAQLCFGHPKSLPPLLVTNGSKVLYVTACQWFS
jgi:hypothetical protein